MRRKRPLEQNDANQSLRDDSPIIRSLPAKPQQGTHSDVGDTIELQRNLPAAEISEGTKTDTDKHASLMAKVFPKGLSIKAMPT